jgi:apolipoprotein D and lipocalin family protein
MEFYMKEIVVFCLLLISCSHNVTIPLTVEKTVDINRYQGKWYAIGWLPQVFTNKCKGQIAYYSLENNVLKIKNECLSQDKQVIDTIQGVAVAKNSDNSILEISFDNFFIKLFNIKGDYEIIKIDSNYTIALVGSSDRKSLWLLSKKESLTNEEKDFYVSIAKKEGFAISKIIFKD